MATLLPEGKQSFRDSAGSPLVGGKVYTYDAGTSTPRPTYQDAAGTVSNTNPVVLDARGEATIFWTGSYKVVLKDSLDVTIWTVDNVVSADAYASSLDAATRADLTNAAAASKGAGMVGFGAALGYAAGTVGGAIQQLFQHVLYPCDAPYNAVGDGVADDTAALAACFAAVPAYGCIDLNGKTFKITQGVAPANIGVTVRNGRIKLNNDAAQFFYAFTAKDYCVFDSIVVEGTGVTGAADVVKYQGGIISGNTGYPAPMNLTPANYVTVRNCVFTNLTAGVFVGGSTGDPVPVGWRVENNAFVDIVGYPGNSEGYGVLFTPANNGSISLNTFKTIRRHAIYLASEASNNLVHGNQIDGVDNIAIQSNTGATQNYADQNIISNNTIRGFTRSINYGYRSSIGIGLYGKFSNYLVTGNKIYGALDTGIDSAGELSGSAYAEKLMSSNNLIYMDPTATDCGIRMDGIQGAKVFGNHVTIRGSIYGMVITSNVTVSTAMTDISGNTIDTTNATAVGFRIALAAARTLYIFRNILNGFTAGLANALTDTSTAGVVRTDLNNNTQYYSTDADFTHNAFGTVAVKDAPKIRHAATLTAIRQVVLANTNVPPGAEVTIMRTGGGAFALNVFDGGTIKALSTGQWGRFGWNGAGWELLGFGSM